MTQHTLKISIAGPRGSGKTLLLNRIRALLAEECSNYTMRMEAEYNDTYHAAIVVLCDRDHEALAARVKENEFETYCVRMKGDGSFYANHGRFRGMHVMNEAEEREYLRRCFEDHPR